MPVIFMARGMLPAAWVCSLREICRLISQTVCRKMGGPSYAILSLLAQVPATDAYAHGQAVRHDDAQGSWRLTVWRDQFSGYVTCRLRERGGHAAYEPYAVGFKLGSRTNVTSAVIRVDAGVPHDFRDLLPELAQLRVAVDGANMATPTGGIVWVPFGMVANARSVWIQPQAGARPHLFTTAGLPGLVEEAKRNGCLAEAQFRS